MAKEKKVVDVTEKKRHRSRDMLRVSRGIKIQAAMAAVRGRSFRDTIRLLGDAEHTFRNTGYLILGGERGN